MDTIKSLVHMLVLTFITADGDYCISPYPCLTEKVHKVELLYDEVDDRMDGMLRPFDVVLTENVICRLGCNPNLKSEDIAGVFQEELSRIESALEDVKNFK